VFRREKDEYALVDQTVVVIGKYTTPQKVSAHISIVAAMTAAEAEEKRKILCAKLISGNDHISIFSTILLFDLYLLHNAKARNRAWTLAVAVALGGVSRNNSREHIQSTRPIVPL